MVVLGTGDYIAKDIESFDSTIPLSTSQRNAETRTNLPDGTLARVRYSEPWGHEVSELRAFLERGSVRKEIGVGDYDSSEGGVQTIEITYLNDSREIVGAVEGDGSVRGIVRPGPATLVIEDSFGNEVGRRQVQITGGIPETAPQPSPDPSSAPEPTPDPSESADVSDPTPTPSQDDGQEDDAQSHDHPMLALVDDSTMLILAAAVGVGLVVWRQS